MEDGTDAQEEAPEDGPQLGDQVILHHFTELGVVAGSMGLELEKREKLEPPFSQVKYVPLSKKNLYLKFICIYNINSRERKAGMLRGHRVHSRELNEREARGHFLSTESQNYIQANKQNL